MSGGFGQRLENFLLPPTPEDLAYDLSHPSSAISHDPLLGDLYSDGGQDIGDRPGEILPGPPIPEPPPPPPPPAETPEDERARLASRRRGRASTYLSEDEEDPRRFSARRYLGANDPGRR